MTKIYSRRKSLKKRLSKKNKRQNKTKRIRKNYSLSQNGGYTYNDSKKDSGIIITSSSDETNSKGKGKGISKKTNK